MLDNRYDLRKSGGGIDSLVSRQAKRVWDPFAEDGECDIQDDADQFYMDKDYCASVHHDDVGSSSLGDTHACCHGSAVGFHYSENYVIA